LHFAGGSIRIIDILSKRINITLAGLHFAGGSNLAGSFAAGTSFCFDPRGENIEIIHHLITGNPIRQMT